MFVKSTILKRPSCPLRRSHPLGAGYWAQLSQEIMCSPSGLRINSLDYWRSVPVASDFYWFLVNELKVVQLAAEAPLLPAFSDWRIGNQAVILRGFCQAVTSHLTGPRLVPAIGTPGF